MIDISESILETIKKLVGIDKDYGVFDLDLITAINSSFMILHQLGVGPNIPYSISGSEEKWTDFSPNVRWVELIKSYIYLRARLLFDPPSTGVLHEAIERQVSEFEWRLMIQAQEISDDAGGSTEPEVPSEPVEGTMDHRLLTNRSAPDQHPISAITGLNEEVEKIPEIMTADEMRKILTG